MAVKGLLIIQVHFVLLIVLLTHFPLRTEGVGVDYRLKGNIDSLRSNAKKTGKDALEQGRQLRKAGLRKNAKKEEQNTEDSNIESATGATGAGDNVWGIKFPVDCSKPCKESFRKFRELQVNEYANCKSDCKALRDKVDSLGRDVEKECFPEKRCWQQLEDAIFLGKLVDKDTYHKPAIVGDDLVTPGNFGKVHLGNPCQESSECRSACCPVSALGDIDEVGPQHARAYENIDDGHQCHRHCQCKNKSATR